MTDPERAKPSLRVHSILYENDLARVSQTVGHLNRAADLAIAAGAFSSVELVYGDCSPEPVLGAAALEALRQPSPALWAISHRFFDTNLGSAGGHNRLLQDLAADCVLIMNPDVMLAPDALIELARPLGLHRTGMVEARQLPVEHPKDYDVRTGETGWATTACALIPRSVAAELNGFDSNSFFLYCDDVDFSWRARLAGYRVLFQPSAVVFHDKRLGTDARWAPSNAEKYYSGEAALMLAHKFSRPDIVSNLLATFSSSGVDHLERAARTFRERREAGTLAEPIDPNHKVGLFVAGFYTAHRFGL
jgi:GT2 family glycosyltransferase